MKKEAGKKSKLWLWLGIALAAVLVIGAVLGIVFLVGQGGKAADDGRPDLYYNLDQDIYMEKGSLSSTREKAEDGLYHIRCAFDGKEVEVLTQDKQLVNFIDTMTVMGIVFDSDGYAVDAIPAKEVATVVAEDVYVQSLEENAVNTNSSIVMNGLKKTIAVSASTGIYNVTSRVEASEIPIALNELGVMDKVSFYGDEAGNVTHIFMISRPRESKVYWRANQFTSGGKTTRVPDENGYYTIPFYCEGEYVEYKCKDVVEVNYIDKQSYYSCHFGLVFDDDGYIIEAIHSYEAIRGIVRSERFDITAIDGNTISTTKIIGSGAGATDKFTIDENVKLYDVSLAAKSEGRMGKEVESLSVGDRIVCFADAEGKTLFVYIAEHIVEEAIWCYNIERKYDSTKKDTKREPDAEGWYTFKVFAEGTIRYVKTKDRAVANEMDSVGAAVFGLTLDGDVVKNVYSVRSVFGYTHFGQGRYITSVAGSLFSCFKTSDPDTLITGIMAPGCKIWNLSPVGTYGAETKLQYGDYIYAYQSPDATIQQIFVMKRIVNLPVYYGTERMYNSTTKETTRQPDADGWYVYTVSRNGKLSTVKTRSKEMASKMDAINPAAMALSVGSDGVVYDAYEARLAYGGYRRAHGYKVVSINGNVVETQYKNSDGTIATRVLTLADDCKTLNVTSLASTFGEYTTVRVGDTITAFTDIYDKTVLLAVRNRKVDNLYWNSLKLYDDTNAVSLREPDAEGWYVYTLACNGKAVTLKTRDKAIADKVDYYGGAFTLNVKDGVILGVGSPSYARNTSGASLLNYDVVKVNGNKVTLKYNQEGSSKDGEIKTITLSSNVKIYEVGPDAGTFAAKTQLRVGDRIRAYASENDSNLYTYVFIRFRDSRDQGVDGYCDVCEKNVYWTPWVGGSFSTAGGHFYLPADVETFYLPCSTGRSTFPESTVCLDLNGHTYYRTKGRAMYVYTNATLNIMDSVGGGTVTSGGIANGTSGGVLGIAGGTVNLYSGTLRLADEHVDQVRAGVVYVGKGSDENTTAGTLNMYGGIIENGEVLGRGGNMDINGGILNMYGGEIRGGVVVGGYEGEHGGGGNIVLRSSGQINVYDGIITGGTAYGSGGNIYSGTGTTNIYGGTVSDGISQTAGGGNIYVLEGLHLYGGVISGGECLAKSGGNIAIYSSSTYNPVFTAENCSILDGKTTAYGGNIYCEVGGTLENVTLAGGQANIAGNIYGSKNWIVKNTVIRDGTAVASGGNVSASGAWELYDVTISGGVSGDRGGNVHVNNGTVTLNSGKIEGGTSGTKNSNGGGNVFIVGGGTLTVAGGQIVNGVSQNSAGNILVGTGTLKVSGGEITGGTAATKAPGVYAYYEKSNVELTGGHIDVLTYADAESFKISGNPVVDLFEITEGKLVDLGEMTRGAQLTVQGSGIFTKELENPNDYMGYFTPAEGCEAIVVVGNALSLGEDTPAPEPDEGEMAPCIHCGGADAEWLPWNGEMTDGHFFLEANMDATAEVKVPAGETLVLDLRGNSYTSTARAFNVAGDLAVMDTVSGGVVTGSGAGTAANGGVILVDGGSFDLYSGTLRFAANAEKVKRGGVLYVQNTSVVNLYGGVIENGRTNERGGNIYVAAGEMNLSGAIVQNGYAESSNANGGGNIFMLGSSVVKMTGGKVIGGNTTKTGGNICVGTATFIMEGGEINGGTATGVGPDLYVYYESSNADIKGGTIETLTYKDAASLKISGNPVIELLEVITAGKTFVLGDLTDGAHICVDADGVFTTENVSAQEFVTKGYVVAANEQKEVRAENNRLLVGDPIGDPEPEPDPGEDEKMVCPHCDGAEAVWTAWDGVSADGHFYLTQNIPTETELSVEEGNCLVLDLRGYEFCNTATRAFYVYGEMAVVDSVGSGSIVGSGAGASYTGGVINVNGGSFDLYSGTVRYAENATGVKQGGVLYMQNNAVVELHGGMICDGRTTERGGNIYANSGELKISGGTVRNGYAASSNANGGGNIFLLGNCVMTVTDGYIIGGKTTKTGGNVCVGTATFIMEGGEISGGSADGVAPDVYIYYGASNADIRGGSIDFLTYKDAAGFKLSGDPVIGLLDVITEGKLVELGQLTEEADIGVRANGVFTNESDYAAEALEKNVFHTSDAYELKLVNKALSAKFAPNHFCAHCEEFVDWAVWDGEATNGHFYLTGNVSATAVIEIPAGHTLVLDLNTYKLVNPSNRVFYVYGQLAIMDTQMGGFVEGACAGDSMQGGVIRVRGGKFDLYSGTVRYAENAAGVKQGGVIYAQSYNDVGATVNIHGGSIEGGKSIERGGNIFVNGEGTVVNLINGFVQDGHSGLGNNSVGGGNVFVMSGGVFHMTGGSISSGVAENYGGNVGVGSGTFLMSGGVISNGLAANGAPDVYVYYSESKAEITGGKIGTLTYKDAASLKISGNPMIELVEIVTAGKTFQLGDLSDGASITVDGEGVFTTANANAADYVSNGWIKASEGKALSENEGVLSIAAISTKSLFKRIIEAIF